MKIKEMPWFTRPWTRLKKQGVSSLSDSELLAIVLGQGYRKENAVDLSNRVLKEYNFNKLSTLSLSELERELKRDIHAMRVQAMFEIFRRTNKLEKHGFTKKIEIAEDVYDHFIDELKNKKKEHFYALYLDTKNRIITKELVSIGILNASLIHAREVFSPAIKANCRSVILVHNHPSGDCEPSPADKELTKAMVDAGKLLGINVLDHVIVGSDKYFSFNEEGILEN